MAFLKELQALSSYHMAAEKQRNTFGVTDLYRADINSPAGKGLNEYIGGGYGRPGNYEIVILFGDTGIGKSTVGLNMLCDPIIKGAKVGMMVLEDEGADVYLRMETALGKHNFREHVLKGGFNVQIATDKELGKGEWTLEGALEYLEWMFLDLHRDVVLLDHLQFLFETVSIGHEGEWRAQQVFMRKLNQLIKDVKKTVILVSHTNKGDNRGSSRIRGSSGIAAAASKILEIQENENSSVPGGITITMRKSRFTARPNYGYNMVLDKGKMIPATGDVPGVSSPFGV
nr:MAG TPA: DNA directed DNA polymerase [Caudoviricetes sp.]